MFRNFQTCFASLFIICYGFLTLTCDFGLKFKQSAVSASRTNQRDLASSISVTSVNPSNYRFNAELVSEHMKMDFMIESGTTLTVESSNMYFKGRHYTDTNFHYVTVDLTNKKGEPEPNVRALFSIPLVKPLDPMVNALDENTLKNAISNLKLKTSANLGLTLPSFYTLDEDESGVFISMCLNHPSVYSNVRYSPISDIIEVQSTFNYFLIDFNSETLLYEKKINNVLDQPASCLNLAQTVTLYNRVVADATLPSFTIPTIHSLLQNTQPQPSTVALLTSFSLFPMISNMDKALKRSDAQSEQPQKYPLEGDLLTNYQKYLISQGITSENFFIVARGRQVIPSGLGLFLEKHSFNVVEIDPRTLTPIHVDPQNSVPIKKEAIADLKPIIYNSINLEFEWVNEFAKASGKDKFYQPNQLEGTPIQYYFVKKELKYKRFMSGALGVSIPIRISVGAEVEPAEVFLLSISNFPRDHLSLKAFESYYTEIQNEDMRLKTLYIPSFKLQKHAQLVLSDFPYLSSLSSELASYLKEKDLKEMKIHQVLNACIHSRGASYTPKKAISKFNKYSDGDPIRFQKPFFFFIVSEKTGFPLVSDFITHPLNDATECNAQ